MKYSKTSKFTKAITSTGFVYVVACFLIAFGAISWFILSRNNTAGKVPEQNSSQQSYPDVDNSYNDIPTIPESTIETPVADVNENVSDATYDKQEQTITIEPQQPTFILPVIGNISKGYSDTALQYSATYGDMRLHTGVDILCEKGTNIMSVGSGTVKSVTDDVKLGRVITVEYQNNIIVKYCGMGSVNVKDGDVLSAGDVIGTSGDIPSECADNPHIHIEVLVDGNSVSPFTALGLE